MDDTVTCLLPDFQGCLYRCGSPQRTHHGNTHRSIDEISNNHAVLISKECIKNFKQKNIKI